jgi:hypothetical protein
MRERLGVKAAYEKAKAHQSTRSNTDPEVAKILFGQATERSVAPANCRKRAAPSHPRCSKSESRHPYHIADDGFFASR